MMGTESAGVICALLTTLSWSIGIFPFTEAARRLGVNPLNHFRLLLATILLAIVSIVSDTGGFIGIFSENFLMAWIWLGLSGIIGLALGDYFAFRMYAIMGAKTGSVLTTLSPAAALVCGKYLLEERINLIGLAGIGLTIAGVMGISLGKAERTSIPVSKHGKLSTGIITGILAALCQGAGLVFAKKGFLLQTSSGFILEPVHATFIRMLVSIIGLSLLTLMTGNINSILSPLLINKDGGLKFAIAGTVFGPFMGVSLSLLTITKIDVAVAQTIFSMVPAMAFVISIFFLRERFSLQSFAGLCIAIAGVLVLIWRDGLFGLLK